MPHPTRAEARALVRARRENEERQAIQGHVDDLLARIVAIERQAVEGKETKGAKIEQKLPSIRKIAEHSILVDQLVRFANALDHTKWRVWLFFADKDVETQALIAALVAPRLACMSTAHRRYKYARA